MIDLYTAATPNGQKIHIMLEETGLAYSTHWVRILEDIVDAFSKESRDVSFGTRQHSQA